jgi:O-antigen/teichoic acid export membrane protein
MLLFGIPLAVGIMLLARPIMELAFGSAFASGAVALQILIWTLPVLMVRMCHGMVLVAHGYQNTHLWIRLLAAAANIVLNIVLIPRYGSIGAASANLTAQLIMFFLCYQQVANKVMHLPVFPSVWRPALASVCMAFFLHWMLESLLLVRIMAGLLVYIFCAWCIGAFTIKDIMGLLGLWSTRVAVEGNAKLTFSQQTMSPRD